MRLISSGFAIIATCLGACASIGGDYAKTDAAWIGAAYEEVVTAWGAPARGTSLNDGRLVYTWYSAGTAGRTSVLPSISIGAGSGYGFGVGVGVTAGASRDITVSCERTLTFRDGRVAQQIWRGSSDFCARFRRH